jgi:DNA-binding NarL/FixJ family response regulator
MSEQVPWKVLIVDDASLIRSLIAGCLGKRFPGIEAQSVTEGYHHAMEYRPQLVLLDVSMPDGNGFELSRRICKELPGTVVCICTLHDEPEFRQAASDSGAAWFVAKQGDFCKDTAGVVRSVLDGAGGGLGEQGHDGPAASLF